MVKVKEIVARFEEFAPKWMAEPGDPIGLQLGDLNREVKKMMITLDVRPETVQEALENGVDFIFAHHPAMFVPVKKFDLSEPQNKMYAELIKNDITVYAAHTNLDNANGGMNDWLAEELNLVDCQALLPIREEEMYKLAVYVPKQQAAQLRQALADAGAGRLGQYSACSFSQTGTGRFSASDAAQPFIGQAGQVSAVEEEKVEVVCPKSLKNQVLAAMYANHPYEEVVFDLYQIEGLGQKYGMGRVGKVAFENPLTVLEYAKYCKEVLGLQGLRLISADLDKKVRTVAVLGGSGAKFYSNALLKGADIYVTGDVSYHVGHDILASGLSVIDPGHHFEKVCKERLTQKFSQWKQQEAWDIELYTSTLNTDPFRFV